jgi:hypothetical protein
MRLIWASGALLLFVCPVPLLAQGGGPAGGPPLASFAPVTGVPIPVLSASGRFSSLNPSNRLSCPYDKVTGRVVSPRLIMVKEMDCGRAGHDNVLVNVQLSNPADTAQMVTGRRVTIAARFKSAQEDRDPLFFAEYLIADNAAFVAGDPPSPSGAQAFTSYMVCQPPELDTLATQLGNELCVQSTLVENLTVTGPALQAAARTPAKLSPQDTAPGNPNTITCRLDPKRSDAHLPAIACARNSYWAWYKAKWRNPQSSTPAPP